MYNTRCYSPIELIDSDIVPAPAEISNEMSKLPSQNTDEYGYEIPPGSMDYPEGDLEEGVSLTRAMHSPRKAHNNQW